MVLPDAATRASRVVMKGAGEDTASGYWRVTPSFGSLDGPRRFQVRG